MNHLGRDSVHVTKRYPVLCHLLPAVMCCDLWMPLVVYLLNKYATSGAGKRMQLLPLI